MVELSNICLGEPELFLIKWNILILDPGLRARLEARSSSTSHSLSLSLSPSFLPRSHPVLENVIRHFSVSLWSRIRRYPGHPSTFPAQVSGNGVGYPLPRLQDLADLEVGDPLRGHLVHHRHQRVDRRVGQRWNLRLCKSSSPPSFCYFLPASFLSQARSIECGSFWSLLSYR